MTVIVVFGIGITGLRSNNRRVRGGAIFVRSNVACLLFETDNECEMRVLALAPFVIDFFSSFLHFYAPHPFLIPPF